MQSPKVGKGEQAHHCAAAADRTRHAGLHAPLELTLKSDCLVFVDFFAMDLIRREEGKGLGWLLRQALGGRPHLPLLGSLDDFTTGGFGRTFLSGTPERTCTGDGCTMTSRAGLPMQGLECVPFHPTGTLLAGCLLTEGGRGKDGILRNRWGEPFLARFFDNCQGPGTSGCDEPRLDHRDS